MLGMRPRTSQLFPAVYAELRRIAAAQMARLPPGQTLQPTALVHETYMKLAGTGDPSWNGSGHFFGAASQAMREIIVDHVRRRTARKRGGGQRSAPLDVAFEVPCEAAPIDHVLAIDRAICELERQHPRKASVVVMRYFGGMSIEQIANALDVTTRTIERELRFARAVLAESLAADGDR